MIERPSQKWRREVAQQSAAVAAGTLPADEAYAITFFPPDFTEAVDAALVAYEREIAGRPPGGGDGAIWVAVERVANALNDADDGSIETTIREELSEYIDQVLVEHGIDVEGLAERRGADPADLAGEWRDW
ncbi:hypothetical protein [Dactylosporangium sp. CA-139066]|uniref:hypothetical protein n=1 Tax=Dactylosporangium sp. CA-139066 TaxID=3239930 RepID=UPI003D93D258